jgi:hypothetical protein
MSAHPSGSLGARPEDSGQPLADANLTSDTGAQIDASLTVDGTTDLDGSQNSGPILDDGDAGEGACTLAALTVDDAGGCGSETMTFQLYATPGAWVGTSGDSPLPAFNWLTIFCPAGNQIDLSPTGLTGGADCADCTGGSFSYPIGSFWAALGDAGTMTQTWNGVFYAVGVGCPGLIQEPPPVLEGACLMPGCAPAGRYVARMCVWARSLLRAEFNLFRDHLHRGAIRLSVDQCGVWHPLTAALACSSAGKRSRKRFNGHIFETREP